ncbi:AAA domain-containing protein [Streptomyces sanglieri]|uniref:AAA domain-containing protein n=1 Tax=Streptomyces sanglieri TaxID=193460 RepID=UPI00352492DD
MPRWLDEMTQAVAALCGTRAAERSSESTEDRQFKYFGDVVHLEDGWYALSTYARQVNPDDLTEMCLAPRNGPSAAGDSAYHVISHVAETERLRLQVGAHAPVHGLGLWAMGRPDDFLDKSLHEALCAIEDPGLAERLVSDRLSPVAPLTSTACAGVLQGAQAQTYLACTTPGIRLVWGPPGTGKTTVLKRAIDHLASRNKRVLLVSGTNIAVDNALEGAVRTRTGLLPGELVRVGTPHLASVADDPRVCLALLVQERIRETEDRRQQTESDLLALRDSPVLTRLRGLDDALSGYDPEAYRQAHDRLAHGSLLTALAADVADADTEVKEATGHRDHAAEAVRRCLAAERSVDDQRAQLTEAVRLQAVLDSMEQELLPAQSAARKARLPLEKARQELDTLDLEQGVRARLRNRKRRAELTQALPGLVARQVNLAEAASRAASAFDRQRELLDPRIDELTRLAHPVDAAELTRLAEATARARSSLDDTEDSLSEARQKHDGLRARFSRAQQQQPGPRPDDRTTVEAAERADFPALEAKRTALRGKAATTLKRCRDLEKQHEQLLKEISRLRARAEPDIIRNAKVVATTLARMRINKAVAAGPYDVVLVDEAAAASLPELVVAVAKAGETAVLLGDFCQLGPIEHRRTPSDTELSRWLTRDCFAVVGIGTPDEALAHPGCAALLTTHRFGPDLTELVNRIAYGSTLPDGPRLDSAVVARNREEDPEIVLITTDRLGDEGLGIARTPRKGKGRWWTAGSVVAQALAEHHRDQGESVGIVTPYNAQADLTHDWLADQGSLHRSPPVEVGTAHRFQGREFDVVVLDLVEDGRTLGWTGLGDLGSDRDFARTGARLFNVGATRARRRVYIVAAWSAVSRAATGTVLAHVREMATPGPDRRILGVRAAHLLGMEESELSAEDSTAIQREIWQAFDGHVRWDAVHDEHDYFPAALEAIDAAKESIWLWAPWYYTRLWDVLPHLNAARLRGVRVVVFVVEDSDEGLRRQLRHPNAVTAADAARRLPELQAGVGQVVRIRTMHQKILVVDERTTFLGSLNTLSHSPRGSGARREIMVRFRGSRFARTLLEHEHASALSRPAVCTRCGSEMEARKYRINQKKAPRSHYWVWACPTKATDPQTGKPRSCGAMREVHSQDAVFVPKQRRI